MSSSKSCLVIAGEKSGEEHVMSFLPELHKRCPEVSFWGVGGDQLQANGVELLYHLSDFSSWGYSGVIKKIPFYLKALNKIEEEAKKRGTQVAILVDFQDFNMNLAKRLKRNGVSVLYYVAPQAWAWKSGRVKKLSENVHTLFTIIPFEKEWFSQRGVKRVISVNHPIWFHYQEYLSKIEEKKISNLKTLNLVLLPGSRKSEVQSLLPEFKDAIKRLKKKHSLCVSLVKASHLDDSLFESIEKEVDFTYRDHELPKVLLESDLCLAASGTVTLITALFCVPTVVTYKTSHLNDFLFYTFVKYSGPVSLANIVHEERLFPELIQEQASGFNMYLALDRFIDQRKDYHDVFTKLKKTASLIGGSTQETAESMAKVLNEK